MRSLRRILFWLFLTLYLAAAPVAILYALGYLYKPGSERGLVQYGLISLASTPDDAQVFLGDSRFTRRTPAVLCDLVPGRYPVRLVRRDHATWSAEVTVEAERATILDRIILLPAALTPRPLDDRRWSDLSDLAGDEYVLATTDGDLGSWAVLDATEGALRSLLPTNSPSAGARVLRHWQVPDNPHLLVQVRQAGRDAYLWIALDEADKPPVDITRLFPEPPDEVTWDRRARHEVFSRVGERVHRLDLKEGAIYPDCAPPALALALRRNRLYALTVDRELLRIDRDGEPVRSGYRISTNLTGHLKRQPYRLHLLPDDLALLHGQDNTLWAGEEPAPLAEGVHAVVTDRESEQLLVVSHRALALIEAKREDPAGSSLRPLHRHPNPIDRATWLHEGTHVLFSSDGRLWLLALDRGGGGPPRPLSSLHRSGAFVFSERGGSVYGLDESRRLTALRLLPPRQLIPLPGDGEEGP